MCNGWDTGIMRQIVLLNTEIHSHSMLSGIWIKMKLLLIGPSHDERACIGGSEYILLETLG